MRESCFIYDYYVHRGWAVSYVHPLQGDQKATCTRRLVAELLRNPATDYHHVCFPSSADGVRASAAAACVQIPRNGIIQEEIGATTTAVKLKLEVIPQGQAGGKAVVQKI